MPLSELLAAPRALGLASAEPSFQPIMKTTWNVAGTAVEPGSTESASGGAGTPCKAASRYLVSMIRTIQGRAANAPV